MRVASSLKSYSSGEEKNDDLPQRNEIAECLSGFLRVAVDIAKFEEKYVHPIYI